MELSRSGARWAAALLLGSTAMAQTLDLDKTGENAAEATLAKFAMDADDLGIAVAELDRTGGGFQIGGYRSDEAMYPASVVKLFYMAYLSHLVEANRLKRTPEIERAARDMIVESDNDATNWILEAITGATSGPELGPKSLAAWVERRQAVNRYFAKLGYLNLNASQKTWYSGPYGRERQGYGPNFERRNMASPATCVRLMAEIALGKAAKPEGTAWMLGLLAREIPAESEKADSQSANFSGQILPKGFKLWSKAGWTDTVRHDVAAVRAPDGREFVWAVFTKDHSNKTGAVPFAAAEVLKGLGYPPLPPKKPSAPGPVR